MDSIKALEVVGSAKTTKTDSKKAVLDWDTLLCKLASNSPNVVQVEPVAKEQFWIEKYFLGGPKYQLKDEFKCLKGRDVVSDLRILVQQVQLEDWKSKFSITKQRVTLEQVSLPLNRRSVLDLSMNDLVKLSKKNWIEWSSLFEDLVTPCYLALDILTGKITEGQPLYNKEIDMELFIVLHRIVPSSFKQLIREVKLREGLKGSAAYKAVFKKLNSTFYEIVKKWFAKVAEIVVVLLSSILLFSLVINFAAISASILQK